MYTPECYMVDHSTTNLYELIFSFLNSAPVMWFWLLNPPHIFINLFHHTNSNALYYVISIEARPSRAGVNKKRKRQAEENEQEKKDAKGEYIFICILLCACRGIYAIWIKLNNHRFKIYYFYFKGELMAHRLMKLRKRPIVSTVIALYPL